MKRHLGSFKVLPVSAKPALYRRRRAIVFSFAEPPTEGHVGPLLTGTFRTSWSATLSLTYSAAHA